MSLKDCHHRLRDHAVTWLFPPRPAGKGQESTWGQPQGPCWAAPQSGGPAGTAHPSPSTTTPTIPGQLPCNQVTPCTTPISPAVPSKPGLVIRKPTGAVGPAGRCWPLCLAWHLVLRSPRTVLWMYLHLGCAEPPRLETQGSALLCSPLWLILPGYDFKESVFSHEEKKGEMSYISICPHLNLCAASWRCIKLYSHDVQWSVFVILQ